MPYLVLIFGLIASLYAFYRFFIVATPEQIKKFFRYGIIILYCCLMIAFALFGRVFISIGLALLTLPFIISYYRNKLKEKKKLEYKSTRDDDK